MQKTQYIVFCNNFHHNYVYILIFTLFFCFTEKSVKTTQKRHLKRLQNIVKQKIKYFHNLQIVKHRLLSAQKIQGILTDTLQIYKYILFLSVLFLLHCSLDCLNNFNNRNNKNRQSHCGQIFCKADVCEIECICKERNVDNSS